MKKTIILFLLTLFPLIVSANGTKIDGIYYNLNAGEKTASVTYLYYNSESNNIAYSGNVVIPTSVFYNGQDYVVTSIDDYAFARCTNLLSVSIPNTVTKIGSLAFGYCNGLLSVSIPNTITTIDEYTFIYCDNLYSIDIPNSVTTIEKGAFWGCGSLTSVTFSESLSQIGEGAFWNCKSLTSIKITDSVVTIGEQAFWMCSNLTTITIPSSLKSIGSSAFESCYNLKKVIIGDVDSWCKISFGSYTSNPLHVAHHLYVGDDEITSVVVSNSVTSLKNYAFYGCYGLKNVIIPNSVTTIGNSCFSGCNALSSIALTNSIKEIGEEAFSGCKKLAAITIPEDLSVIKKQTFYGCSSLKNILIPSSVEYIYQEAFNKCSALEKVSIYAITPPFLYDNSFSTYSIPLYVPVQSYNDYSTAQGWKNFTNIYSLTGDEPETSKCATPTIYYSNGKLEFFCETEGSICHSTITNTDIASYETSEVNLSVTYNISVYATHDGYDASDIISATLCWIDVEPKTEGITETVSEVRAIPVLIHSNNGIIQISGVSSGTNIKVFNIAGVLVGSGMSTGVSTSIITSMKKNETAILKIGEKSIKTIIH